MRIVDFYVPSQYAPILFLDRPLQFQAKVMIQLVDFDPTAQVDMRFSLNPQNRLTFAPQPGLSEDRKKWILAKAIQSNIHQLCTYTVKLSLDIQPQTPRTVKVYLQPFAVSQEGKQTPLYTRKSISVRFYSRFRANLMTT